MRGCPCLGHRSPEKTGRKGRRALIGRDGHPSPQSDRWGKAGLTHQRIPGLNTHKDASYCRVHEQDNYRSLSRYCLEVKDTRMFQVQQRPRSFQSFETVTKLYIVSTHLTVSFTKQETEETLDGKNQYSDDHPHSNHLHTDQQSG